MRYALMAVGAGAVAWFVVTVVREMTDEQMHQWTVSWDDGTGWRVLNP